MKKTLIYIILSALFFMTFGGINISINNQSNFVSNKIEKNIFLNISFVGNKVYAEDTSNKESSSTNSKQGDSSKTDASKWIDIWNGIMAGLASVLGVLTYFVTLLLDPDFVSGKMFGIDKKLHDLWILISNVVYFVFAFILVWIAFMNILGKGDKWELKQALPKFIVGVLIVPFSWFFVSLVVSFANVLTFAALALPADTFPDYQSKIESIEIPKTCTLDLEQGGGKEGEKQWIKCEGQVSLGSLVDASTFGLISSYTYGLLKVDKLSTIEGGAIINGLKTVEDLIVYLLFSGIFVLAYSILIIALAIVLLVRVIWLWIYMALSPFFGLAYFFGKDSSSEIFKKINLTEFISLAMVPVYATLALSFGFLFMSITTNGLTVEGNAEGSKGVDTNKYKIDKEGITLKFKNTKGEAEDVKLIIKGGGALAQVASSTSKFTGDLFSSQLGVVGAIFLNVFGVVVFWVAIMAALQASTITKEVVAPIKQFGESVGSLVSKAPTYAPIFPGGQSMQSLQNIPSQISSTISSNQAGKATSFIDKNLPMFSSKAGEIKQSLEKLKGDIKANNSIGATDKLNGILKKMDFKGLQQSYDDGRKALLEYLKAFGPEKYKKMKESDLKNEATLKLALRDAYLVSKNKGGGHIVGSRSWEDAVEVGEYNNWQKGSSTSSSQNSQPTTQNINIKFANKKVPSDGELLSLVRQQNGKLKDNAVNELLKILDKKQEMKRDEFLKVLEEMLEKKGLSLSEAQTLALNVVNTGKIKFKD